MNQEMARTGVVFVQTNEERNRVLAFARDAAGGHAGQTSYETGGRGSMTPHLPSQGSVVLSGDRRFLLVANAGSGDVSVIPLSGVQLEFITHRAETRPRSIAERKGTVFVMTTGKAPHRLVPPERHGA